MAFPSGYTKYQEITIDATKVSADLTDYVIYVDLADLVKAGDDVFDTCRTDGGDLRATKTDGTTQLPIEVVAIDTTAKTGKIHIKFDGVLSSSTDTVIRLWYNGVDTALATTATYGRDAVWSDYRAVWHLEDLVDATGNGYTLTANGSSAATASGKVGGGYDLPGGSNDYMTIPDGVFNSPSEYTINMWYDPDSTSFSTSLITFQNDYAVQLYQRANDNIEHEVYSGATHRADSGSISSGGGWYKLTGDYDGSDIHIFKDGTLDDTTAASDPVVISVASRIGAHRTGTGSEINGKVDEVRLRNTATSTGWETTEYNNQNAPDTFITAGDEETSGGGATDVTTTPSTQVITSSVIAPTVTAVANASVSAGTQVITSSVVASSVSVASNVSVSAATQVVTASSISPSVIAGGNVGVTASAQVITASAVSPTVIAIAPTNVTVVVTTQVVTAIAVPASVSIQVSVSTSVGVQTVTATAVSPTVTGDLNTVVTLNTATISAVVPTLAQGGVLWGQIGWGDTTNDWTKQARSI